MLASESPLTVMCHLLARAMYSKDSDLEQAMDSVEKDNIISKERLTIK